MFLDCARFCSPGCSQSKSYVFRMFPVFPLGMMRGYVDCIHNAHLGKVLEVTGNTRNWELALDSADTFRGKTQRA
jgi:hypothetical protein